MSESKSLNAKVEEIIQKSNKYDTRTNVEERVKEAKSSIRSLNRELVKLDDEFETLRFYSNVSTDVFDRDLPGEVEEAHTSVRSVSSLRPDELVSKVQDNRIDDHIREVRDAASQVESAREEVEDQLQEIQSEWESKTKSAKAIQRIMGGEGEVLAVVSDIEDIIQNQIWNPKTSEVSVIAKDWRGAKARWESGVGIDWDELQSKYDLSDETIARLKNLSGGNEINLSELEDVVMDDIMRVNDLRKAMEISISYA
jgi:chromosome segregation ATPase